MGTGNGGDGTIETGVSINNRRSHTLMTGAPILHSRKSLPAQPGLRPIRIGCSSPLTNVAATAEAEAE